ncbi:MAG: BrnA antitoxin family protein [Candidatus Binatia bacterium]
MPITSLRRVGRPPIGDEPRKLIAIRLDPRFLEWVRKTAARKRLPYQSLINDILAREMKNAKGASSLTKSFEQDIDRPAHLE